MSLQTVDGPLKCPPRKLAKAKEEQAGSYNVDDEKDDQRRAPQYAGVKEPVSQGCASELPRQMGQNSVKVKPRQGPMENIDRVAVFTEGPQPLRSQEALQS